jgi:hypothetical protein
MTWLFIYRLTSSMAACSHRNDNPDHIFTSMEAMHGGL